MEFYESWVFDVEGLEQFADAVNESVDRAIRETWDTYSEREQATLRKASAKHGGMPHPPHVLWTDDNLPTEVEVINPPTHRNSGVVTIPRLTQNAPWDPDHLESWNPTYSMPQYTFKTWVFAVPIVTGTYYDATTNILHIAAHKRIYRMEVWTPSTPELKGTDDDRT